MFRLNRQLAEMIGRVGGYDVRIEEVHHTQKKDAPSGTAITLAEGDHRPPAGKQELGEPARGSNTPPTASNAAEAHADRSKSAPYAKAVPGIHTVTYESEDDVLELQTHDQEPPHAGPGGRHGRRIPLRQTGRLLDGRPAEISTS